MTPGSETSEFKVLVAYILYCFVMAGAKTYGLDIDSVELAALILGPAYPTARYSQSRAMVKTGGPIIPPPPPLGASEETRAAPIDR